ncbi:epimerase family protein SDR39U1 [Parasteatoda tepidariorum]|nr:epimerase family protein SDR39U1 [Parasteatoda tepidariorum]XP_015915969.1 epimerase family protein SDR39U1 [Parasteatoda tepidariorum]XP_015915970.1 epimerase family protein SDR39U1 [Parasteatoda tepidariorum]XP_015915972.1 epimerase family protein SDR39U1 [Parasteatoda tepidariorum]XP_042909436.1 epimerase family protein SDR39U1 [Parasteatoda tepidariorum]XP_042909438.1 epimerase family protein SDR39U1 [Parasteatoda tepidariorum]
MTLGTVVIGGGSGFIGRAIARNLSKIGYDVLTVSRQPKLNSISWNDVTKEGLPKSCVAVINVAGQNILDAKRRWTPGFQQNVYASRIHTTKLLAEEIQKMDVPPKVFGVISGVGFYPPSKTETYTEESPGCSEDYFSQLCSDWEAASVLPPHLNVRRFVVRSGVVLGRTGGIIQQMFWPFYFGVGGTIGSGKQYFPWIHIDDIAGIFTHGVQSVTVHGILNGVSPEIVTNKEFTKAFSRALWRPAVLPIPEFAINLAFGGERARMMMEGQKVVPQRTLESGYKFLYPDIKSAVKECAHIIMDLNKR